MSHILEPRSLNATDVRRVHYLLITDKSSPELDQLFERRYYPPRILQQLRQETFRDDNNTVGSFIQTLLDRYHLKEAKETIQRPLRRMLIDGDISLQMRCYLICRPSLLRAFEKLECPPASKDNLNQFIEKYRRQRYTTYINLYQQRPHWENIIHAARYGHRHVLNTLIKRCPRNVSPGSVDLRNARMAALRNGHLDIYQKLSMLGEGLHPYMILLDAFSSGNLEPLAFMSLNIDTIQHVLPDLAEHVGGSGKIEAFDRLLSMSVGDPSPEIYRRCLKGAITKRCLRLFHHLKQIRSDIVEAYMPETKISCGNHIPMLQLLLAEGARRPGIFDGLHASAGHPDLLEVVTRYHPLISTHVILTLLESLMLDYNYESFDVIVDLVRYRFDGLGTELYEDVYRKILPVATKSNSAHFFDTIFGLRGNIPFSGIQVMSSIHPDIQSHIFLQCIDKFEAHPYIPLSQAISNNDKEKFDILYRRYGKKVSPERLCENAFVHGKSRYFIFLLPKCYRGWSGAIDDILKEFHLPSRLSGNCLLYTSPSPRD